MGSSMHSKLAMKCVYSLSHRSRCRCSCDPLADWGKLEHGACVGLSDAGCVVGVHEVPVGQAVVQQESASESSASARPALYLVKSTFVHVPLPSSLRSLVSKAHAASSAVGLMVTRAITITVRSAPASDGEALHMNAYHTSNLIHVLRLPLDPAKSSRTASCRTRCCIMCSVGCLLLLVRYVHRQS